MPAGVLPPGRGLLWLAEPRGDTGHLRGPGSTPIRHIRVCTQGRSCTPPSGCTRRLPAGRCSQSRRDTVYTRSPHRCARRQAVRRRRRRRRRHRFGRHPQEISSSSARTRRVGRRTGKTRVGTRSPRAHCIRATRFTPRAERGDPATSTSPGPVPSAGAAACTPGTTTPTSSRLAPCAHTPSTLRL